MKLDQLIEFNARVEELEELGPRFAELMDLITSHLKDATGTGLQPIMIERLFENLDDEGMAYWKGWFEHEVEELTAKVPAVPKKRRAKK